MTDTTWAAKVLEGVPRLSAFQTRDVADRATDLTDRKWLRYDDALAAIAKLGAGDGLLASIAAITCPEAEAMSDGARLTALIHYADKAAAHIAALTERNDWLAKVAHTAAEKGMKAEAERDALRAKVARLEGALTDMPKAVLRTTVCQGPVWPDDRPGVWLAALEACAKSVQAAVDAALTDGGSND